MSISDSLGLFQALQILTVIVVMLKYMQNYKSSFNLFHKICTILAALIWFKIANFLVKIKLMNLAKGCYIGTKTVIQEVT